MILKIDFSYLLLKLDSTSLHSTPLAGVTVKWIAHQMALMKQKSDALIDSIVDLLGELTSRKIVFVTELLIVTIMRMKIMKHVGKFVISVQS